MERLKKIADYTSIACFIKLLFKFKLVLFCTFDEQLLGKHDVFEAQGSGCTDEAVQRIIESTKKVLSTF